FILSRHRQNMEAGMDVERSASQAVATAGSAVVFAGATVVIALVGLTVVNIPFLTVMGLAAAAPASIAGLISLTPLPAPFCFARPRLQRRNRVLARRSQRAASRDKASVRWAGFVTRKPLPVLLVGVGLLVLVALPAMHVKLGLPDGGSQSTSTTERRSYDLL